MEEAPETGKWVALPILGVVSLALAAVICSLIAVSSPGLAAVVFIAAVGLIAVGWLLGHLAGSEHDV